MYEAVARFSIKFRWAIVVAWLGAVVAAMQLLPSLSSVTQTSNPSFLPASAPCQRAAALAAPFQGKNASATATIVAASPHARLTAADDAAIARIEQATRHVLGVTAVRDLGASADGRARQALVVTRPIPGGGGSGNPVVVDAVRHAFAAAAARPGLAVHLTGPLAQATDAASASAATGSNIRIFTLLFVIVLLFVVFRALLAALVTLAPAVLSLLAAGPLIGAAGQAGVAVSPITQQLLIVLLIGAGTDYGLFLVFRLREEMRAGKDHREALVAAMRRVGEAVTFSAITVVAALSCLALASFGLYRGLGPALAIGVAVLLAAALTLLPAMLAITGRAVFWPSQPKAGQRRAGGWGSLAAKVVARPRLVLAGGVLLLGVLTAGLAGFTVGGITAPGTPGSDSAAGTAALERHFPAAGRNPEILLLRYGTPVWNHPASLAAASRVLGAAPGLRSVIGPLNPDGRPMPLAGLERLHSSPYVSPDGRTVQFQALPKTGPAGSRAAVAQVPAIRVTLASAARGSGASTSGVAGLDAATYDIGSYSTHDLLAIAPVVLLIIGVLLGLLLRSVVAPLYLIATVALTYLASLGFANVVFVRTGTAASLVFVIPILLFIFAMALGEDYNILLMSRVREEARTTSLREAVVRAVDRTGGTITAAGIILGGTFAVLGIAGNNAQARQLGFTIAFAVLLDTFFVRTMLVPSIAVLLGRWNWWPSALSRREPSAPAAKRPIAARTP